MTACALGVSMEEIDSMTVLYMYITSLSWKYTEYCHFFVWSGRVE